MRVPPLKPEAAVDGKSYELPCLLWDVIRGAETCINQSINQSVVRSARYLHVLRSSVLVERSLLACLKPALEASLASGERTDRDGTI